jgi:NitT/TauT family transport system substrate-binding protein
MLRRKFNTYLTGAASCVTAGCGHWQENKNVVRLAVAGTTGLQYLPHILASELGLYQQNGIEPAVENLAGGSKAMRALLGGSVDVVAGYFDHPIRITARGRTVRSFAVLNTCPGNAVLVSHLAAARIRGIRDLRNGVIGVTDLGSQGHWFINYLAWMQGIPPDALNVIPVGVQANAVAALDRGSIDVWSGFEPGVTRFLSRHPQGIILADARSPGALSNLIGSPVYPGAVLYSTAGWLNTVPEKARRLARAVRTALQWIHAHTPEEIMDKVPKRCTGEERNLYLEALRKSYEMYSPDALMPSGGPEIALKVLAASVPELRATTFDLKDTWTNAFIQD